jgi:quercetin dioxygenase-like cupin family protein
VNFRLSPSISNRSIFWPTDRKFNAYYADFHPVPTEKIRVHQHPGVEFIYVLKGKLRLKIGADQETLEAGDSLYFDSQLAHGYSRSGTKPCSAIVVTAE